MAGEQPGKQGSAGSMLTPTWSPSLAHPMHLISDSDVFCQTCLHPLLVRKERQSKAMLCPGFAGAMGSS